MYRALKTAQNDLHTTLLKFADEVIQVVESKHVEPISNAIPNSQAGCCETQDNTSAAIQLLSSKQDIQFRVLNGSLNSINDNMAKIVALLSENRAVFNTATTIPSIQPTATNADLKNVGTIQEVSNIDEEEEVEVEVEDADEAQEEVEVEEVEVEEVEEEEVEDADEAQEEAELEVEEWTYKGRLFFKDTNNTVYAKDGDDVGEPVGTYDPVKNLLKKLAPN